MLDAPDGGGYIRPCDRRRPSPRLPWWISRCATGAVCASPSARPKRFTSRSPTWSSIGARVRAAANASPPAPSARSRWSPRDLRHRCAGHWCGPGGRDARVGTPVRCAEGVGDAGLREFVIPDGAPWVARKIRRVVFVAPDDTEVKVAERDVGWILDRTRFDSHLAERAVGLGAELRVSTEAAGMTCEPDGRWRVRLHGAGGDGACRARVVIGTDGVEAMVGRWAGLETRVPARDMESCAQYVVEGIDFDPDAIYLQFGADIAPGGYAWVFPKSPGVANVGLGLVALKADARNARQYLDAWIARRYPRGTKTACTVGGVIAHTTIRQTYTDGVLVAGDAAHMINPLSGGGIVNAMKAGRLAGGVAAAAIMAFTM